MILKKFFGKTIEAAKKSAQQMYGDDFLLIESSEGDGENKEAKITIVSDANKGSGQEKTRPGSTSPKAKTSMAAEGVKFERSSQQPKASANNGTSSKLKSLRKIAEKQVEAKEKAGTFGLNLHKAQAKQNGSIKKELNEQPKEPASGTVYSRALVRPKNNTSNNSQELTSTVAQEAKPGSNGRTAQPKKSTGKKFITHFKESRINEQQTNDIPPVSRSSRRDQREITALHKRFDKVEALLDSALISANLDYASHPAFQQLVHTGINTSVIAGWFSKIIEEGIDPYDQSEIFMSKLAAIIRDALGTKASEEPQKFMLFAGPSGAGKTHLIMKLSQHPDFMLNKKIAVVSVYPQDKSASNYYTILEAYCNDQNLPHFKVKNNLDVTKQMEQWKEFDHVLIDTPSISIEQDNSFREFWKVRQLLSPLAPLEVHYVVNASMNRFYFRNSSAKHHPLQPDYVAITHLDEVSQWGAVIPFLQEMGCNARYISSGKSMPNSLNEFDPQWFAHKVLQEI
ncbi:MAG: hypothetical protein FH748_00710 [Balneolaceae bacterium]|nr:hypothetical protein [Balneolaceae bacterium]